MFLPQSAPQWHAALNDFPSLLLLLAVVFEFAAVIGKRESLRGVAFSFLMVGAVGTLLAVISGLLAEETIEHGGSVHLVMARHETLAIVVAVLFGGLAIWRTARRNMLPRERGAYLGASGLGLLVLLWTAHLGGTIVYEYGGGISTQVLEGALSERARGHSHSSGETVDGEPGASSTQHEHE